MTEVATIVRGAGGGGKSGGGGGGISEAPDTLSSVAFVRFIDLIGEGEIGGLVNGEYSIYLDGVPLRSLEGTANYKPFRWDARVGTQSQTPIPGFTGTQSENSVGIKILSTQGRVSRVIADSDADAVRVTLSVNGLSETQSDGKIIGSSVAFKIWVKRSNQGDVAWILARDDVIDGKTMARYQRSYEIPIASVPGTGNFDVSVQRITPEPTSALIVNDLYWDSYTIINYEQFSYPNSALLALELDSRYFSQVPTRAYHVRGLLVRVPKNYYPDGSSTYGVPARGYATTGPGTTAGAWDGTFKIAWTNNPAWCYYDLLTNKRYGLGKRVPEAGIDKWALYQVGQYCDEMVPTGVATNISDILDTPGVGPSGMPISGIPMRSGPYEPRFTLNCVINTKGDAFKVLNQLTSAFRGMAYWSSGSVTVTQDRPTDPSMIYTNANVENGVFTYQGSARSNRHTVVLVGWNDPAEDFKQKFEYVEDRSGIARYGIRSTEIVAFGCTSRSQARRVGLWMLYTERLESEVVAFRVGLDSAFVKPGEVVKVLDGKRAGARWGGRIIASSLTTVTLDAPVTLTAGAYTLSVMSQTGDMLTRTVNITSGGSYSVLTVTASFGTAPNVGVLWTLSSAALSPLLLRVVSVAKDSPTTFTITGLQHNPTKYSAVELGVPAQTPSTSILKVKTVPAVTGLVAVESSFRAGTVDATTYLEVSWNNVSDPLIRGYKLKVVGNVQGTIYEAEIGETSVTIQQVVPDTYTVSVYAVNQLGTPGATASVQVTVTGSGSSRPIDVAGFTATSVPGGIKFTWTENTAPTYAATALHIETTWADATAALFDGKANTYVWPWPASGTYTVMAKHRDLGGQWSLNAVSANVVVSPEVIGIGPSALSKGLTDKIDLVEPMLPSISSLNQAISELSESITNLGLKAFDTDGILRDAGVVIDPTSGKVTITALEATKNSLTQLQTTVDAQTGTIASKAAQATVDGLTTRLDTAEQSITAMGNGSTAVLELQSRAATLEKADSEAAAADVATLLAMQRIGAKVNYDLAVARQEMNTSVIEQVKAEANSRTTLISQINQNIATLTQTLQTVSDANSSNASAITSLQAGVIIPFESYITWEFNAVTESWVVTGATNAANTTFLRHTSTSTNPYLASPTISIVGAQYTKVRVRLRRTSAAANWEGALYWATAARNGYSDTYKVTIAGTAIAQNTWIVLEWDVESNTDWTGGTIVGIRLDLGTASGDVFDIDWISVGRRGVGTSVSQIAAVETKAQAAADATGNLTASYAFKAQTTRTDGKPVLASLQLLSAASGTGATSQIVLAADSLMFVPSSAPDSTLAPLFSTGTVDGVSTFIVSATRVGDATITNTKIGGDIWSTNYVSGTSGWIIQRNGYAEFSNVKVRGDVQANSVTAGSVTVNGIAVGAVSVTAGGSSTGSGNVGAAWADVYTQVVTLDASNNSVMVFADCDGNIGVEGPLGSGGSSTGTLYFRVVRDSVAISTEKILTVSAPGSDPQISVGYNKSFGFVVRDTPGLGTFTYRLQAYAAISSAGASYATWQTPSIFIIGLKR